MLLLNQFRQSIISLKKSTNFYRSWECGSTVSYQQSVVLHKKLVELGVKTEFITVEGGLHGKFDKVKNDEINIAMMKFLAEVF